MLNQSNLDYLFQVTAPIADRALGGIGTGGFDRPGFGEHLAQASGPIIGTVSNDESRERPAPSVPLEPIRHAADDRSVENASSNVDSPEDEYGGCAETDQPAACGDEEHELANVESDTDEANAAEASRNPTSAEETGAHEESETESQDETDGLAEAAVIDANGDVDAEVIINPLPVELSDQVNEAGHTGTPDVIESDAIQSATPYEHAEKAPSGLSDAAAADSRIGSQTFGVELKATNAAQGAVPNGSAELQAAAIAPAAVDSQQADVDSKSSAKSTSGDDAAKHASQEFARDRAVLTPTAAIPTSSQNVAGAARRTSDKVKATDDSRRKQNERSEMRASHRNDAAGASIQAPGNSVVADIRSDVMTTQSTTNVAEENTKTSSSPSSKSDALLHPLARANRGQGAASRAGRADSAHPLPRIDSTRFVGRVAKAIQTASERGGALQLRLSPPELGSLRLQLAVHEGVMTASLEAESSTARQLLLDHLPSLRDRLAEQNIRIDRFDVDVRQDGSGGQPDPRAAQQEGRQPQSEPDPSRRERARVQRSDASAPERTATHTRMTDNGLNVLA
jgi:flagellar hook-length control protein FliK